MEPFLGQIQAFGFQFNPRGWAQCNGQLLAISSNDALFSLLGTAFGGDGRTTFGLPDLRGRSIVHVGTGPGFDTIPLGRRAGRNQLNITTANMPSHTHTGTLNAGNGLGNVASAGGNQLAANTGADTIFNTGTTTTPMASGNVTLGNTGGNIPVSFSSPRIVINYCIALLGVYPSRS